MANPSPLPSGLSDSVESSFAIVDPEQRSSGLEQKVIGPVQRVFFPEKSTTGGPAGEMDKQPPAKSRANVGR